MTFLNPAVLFGLLAASIPVLIHLLNLRKLKKIDFSTLKFLKELQRNKIRKIKIKQWLLLALRVLIILMIVTAFARPTIEGVSIGGTSSAAKTSVVFILDDTFSMSVVDQQGSFFNQAKQMMKKIISKLEEGDDISIVLVSHSGNAQKLTNNIGGEIEKLDKLKINYVSGDINHALIKASEILNESKNFNKEIYVLTDFQKTKIAQQDQLTDLGEALSKDVKLYFVSYSGKDVNNISVDKAEVKTVIFEPGKPVDVSAQITNHSDRNIENLVVSLFIGSERKAQTSVNLNSGESKEVELSTTVDVKGQQDVSVEIEDDDINYDNKRFASINIPESIPVLILYENESDIRFLTLALNSANASGIFKIDQKSFDKILSTQLNNYKVIFSVGSPSDVNLFSDFLNNGGGLVLFPSSSSDEKSFNQVLSKLNLPAAEKIITIGNENQNVELGQVELNNPLFEDIFQKDKKIEMESPSFKKYFRISTQGKGKNIIGLLDESSLLGEYDIKYGKVMLFNISPVLSWSNFPVTSIFAPLMNRMVYYLNSDNRFAQSYICGETINVDVSKRTLPQIKIKKPDGLEELENISDKNASNNLAFTNDEEPGNYKFYSSDNLLTSVSVNTDPKESVTKYISSGEFEDYLNKINFNGKVIEINKSDDPTQIILQARFGSELWRYFVLIALVLALIEMAVARSSKKDISGLNDKGMNA